MGNDPRIKDLETVKEVFDKFGVKFFLVYGAVLGLHRDGKLINHDDDIDMAVVQEVDFKTRKAIGWTLFDLGFSAQPISFNVFGRMENTEEGYNGTKESGIIVCERNFKFTIFFFEAAYCQEHQEYEYVCTPKEGAIRLIATPAKFFETGETITVNKKKYLVPSPVEEYLEESYIDWTDRDGRDHSPTYPTAHPNYKYNE